MLTTKLSTIIVLAATLFAIGGQQAAAQNPPPQYDPSLYSDLRWRCIGPFRGGRTVAITGVDRQPGVFYMAQVDGGVWKTDDFGNTWHPIFDEQSSGSVGAIAVAPSDPNIIYVGSGEGLQRPDLAVGDGMYKSSDAGKTWTHLGLRDAQQITDIIVDSDNPQRLFVSVQGHPYGPNAERGVFRSLDGGSTFQKVLYKDENTGAADLAFDPQNPQIVYAVLWAARVAPWEVRDGSSFIAAGSGLFKSEDGGDTWRALTKGLPNYADDKLGRMGIAVSHSDRNRLYATIEAADDKAGIYRSDDFGASWRQVSSDHRIGGRGPGAMGIAVAPDNPDTIYVANTTTWKSTDGGKTFIGFKGAPGGDDYQRIWISADIPKIMALSADQGAAISVNGGATWSSWYNQPTAQFYHVTTDNKFPYSVYAAQQESGSARTASRSDYGEITFRDWIPVGVEEYGYIAVDPLDDNLLYGGRITRTSLALGEVADIAPEILRRGEYRYDRSLPIVFSPKDPHTLYFSANVLFKTTDGGRSWQIISPDLSRPSYEIPANLGAFTASDPQKGRHRGVIYAVAPSYKDVNTIWAGTDDGLIHLTRDGGKSWYDITPPQLTPWSKVSIIEASHSDPASAYAAINRFRLDDLRAHIYRTRNYGKTWTEITKGLPDNAPVNVVREDPSRRGLLFAGTETSVYVSFDDGDDWQPLQLNLPHTSMRDLTIHGDDLIVATHGRSFWILDDITPLRQLTGRDAAQKDFLFAPQTAIRFRWNRNTDTPLPPETPAGQNPPDGAIIDYYLAPNSAAAAGPVTLEIFDSQNHLVRRYSSDDKPEDPEKIASSNPIPMYWVRPERILSAQPGMHRFVWDLHYTRPNSLNHGFPIAAIYRDTPELPRGALAFPGSYTVKLHSGKTDPEHPDGYLQPLLVKIDPRIKTSDADLAQQFAMESAAVIGMNDTFAALAQLQSVRAQIKERLAAAGKAPLGDALNALDLHLGQLEGSAQGSFFGLPPSGKQPENFAAAHQHFAAMLGVADSYDGAPTSTAIVTFKQLEDDTQQLLNAWKKIKDEDIARLNADLSKSGQPALDAAKPPAKAPESDDDGDDEP
ncbi:MAG: glycoside hydrolase [Candidatus Acidiferrum sp.]